MEEKLYTVEYHMKSKVILTFEMGIDPIKTLMSDLMHRKIEILYYPINEIGGKRRDYIIPISEIEFVSYYESES